MKSSGNPLRIVGSIATAAILCLAAGAATAAPPVDLAGTTWTVQVNRGLEQLVIATQSGAGAPGAANCRIIDGAFGNADVRGWYCPSTGRISFVHRNASTGYPVRVFTGNLSDDIVGQPTYMAGTVAIFYATFGDFGEYNFSATK